MVLASFVQTAVNLSLFFIERRSRQLKVFADWSGCKMNEALTEQGFAECQPQCNCDTMNEYGWPEAHIYTVYIRYYWQGFYY
jgi:hypothetical protein